MQFNYHAIPHRIFEDYIAKLVKVSESDEQAVRRNALNALHEHLDNHMNQHCYDDQLESMTLEQHWQDLNKHIVTALTTFLVEDRKVRNFTKKYRGRVHVTTQSQPQQATYSQPEEARAN